MNKFFYARLARTNIYKNRKMYLPYILACIGTITMFYIMHFITGNPGILEISGGDSLKAILNFGTIITGIFSCILLFYTNGFLIKQRKKEIGLFNILGMEKKHIAKVMLWEVTFIASISIVAGLVSGVVISKLMFLLLQSILHFQVPLTYIISKQSIWITAILFFCIFILTFLNNVRHIHLAKPIELLKGSQAGEKEPKTRWLLVCIGIVSLGIGYYIALSTETPLAALDQLFLAVLLVIIGTYAMFIAGTIALLKLLRKNKKFYYQTKHFISVSGMIYRMKQNAVGLASICILSTMVLVTLSTTISLYVGMENLLANRFPKNISVSVENFSEEKSHVFKEIVADEVDRLQINIENPVQYRLLSFAAIKKGNRFLIDKENMASASELSIITVIPLEDYNQMMNRTLVLEEDEVLLFTYRGETITDTLILEGRELRIKEELNELPVDGIASALATNTYYLIVKDVETAKALYPSEFGEINHLSFYYGFDTDSEAEKEVLLIKALSRSLHEAGINGYIEGLEESRESFYSLYGGFFFLGIFLGTLFLMATVLIIYYKQISEGYDDKKRFEIMQKVGLTKDEIKQAIKSQVLIVFFLPLLMAIIHIAFGFNIFTKLLELFNLTDVGLFAICTLATILVFAIVYAIVYLVTAKEYYKIVS